MGKMIMNGVPYGASSNEDSETSSNYSTEEKIIGTWIDGKPIYQKTFNIANASLASTNLNLNSYIDLINVNELIDYKCILHDNDENRNYIMPYARIYDNEAIHCQILVLSDNTVGCILFTRGYTGYTSLSNIRLTLQYTKTTD